MDDLVSAAISRLDEQRHRQLAHKRAEAVVYLVWVRPSDGVAFVLASRGAGLAVVDLATGVVDGTRFDAWAADTRTYERVVRVARTPRANEQWLTNSPYTPRSPLWWVHATAGMLRGHQVARVFAHPVQLDREDLQIAEAVCRTA